MYFQFPFWGPSLSKDNALKWELDEQNFEETFLETQKTDNIKH